MRSLLCLLSLCCLCVCALAATHARRGGHEPGDTLQISDSLLLKEVIVSVAMRPVVMKGDTLVYDVASFSLAEGSRLRELLKRLPGVEVGADGTVKAQGRVVTRILLNGKDFFAANKTVALNHLPVAVLTEVKVYEQVAESDEELGLRPGYTERVIDVTTKEDKDNGWFCDASGGAGTEERYVGNVSLSQFNDVWQNMLTAGIDNLPGTFGIGDSYYEKLTRTPSTSNTDRQSYNVVIGRNKDAWEVNGTAYLNRREGESGAHSLLESFLQNEKSYTGTTSSSHSKSYSLNSSLSMEWRGRLTSLRIEPTFVYNSSDYKSSYCAYTYDADPYLFNPYPLEGNFRTPSVHLVNSNRSESEAQSSDYALALNGRLTRRLGARGNSLRIDVGVENDRARGKELYLNHVIYYRHRWAAPSLRYTDNPQRTLQAHGKITYVEPLGRRLKLLAEYGFSYRKQRMEQPVYSLDRPMEVGGVTPLLPIVSPRTYSDSLSRFATNVYTNHRAKVMVQYAHNDLNMSLGVQCTPQRTSTRYRRFGVGVDTVRTVVNWSPEFSLYYKRGDAWNVSLQYNGSTSQPDLFYLLPVPDDTDPLNRRMGNPGLRPSFTHTVSASFFAFNPEVQRQVSLSVSARVVQNALAQHLAYDSKSGTRIFTPVNINGNRAYGGTWVLGTSFRNHPEWYVDMQGEMSWLRDVGLQQVAHDRLKQRRMDDTKYVTRQVNVQNYLGIQWQQEEWSVKPYAYASYAGARSTLSGAGKRDVWAFGYGAVVRWEAFCGVSVGADVYNHSRRGYIGNDLNNDELIFDAEVAYSFLKGKVATVRLQGCDLLGQRALTRGYMGVSGRGETAYTHSVNSYVLLTFSYRFGLFGLRWPWGRRAKA